ncbi:uncharacterized protein LY89DRAFT_628514 [Mollisia scopiformis]|uniref:Uncharacterized protein n=1 Tax=Mollisia scopiformis TaxID=149040 RepID=A0A132BC14_MOLSC|nr:uncharacterized protein LY89DRAFT_628514 [Mollisia scopiformis]KUJ09394.1 hypothetical protein LY89DRAFT_628514 [Mollisia scopiformis]
MADYDYPGLGLPLRHFHQDDNDSYPLGIHGNCWGSDSDLLPVREVAMMIIMDRLMDKPDWEKKVFDDEIIAKWRKEALEYPDDSLWKQATGGKVHNRWAGQRSDDETTFVSSHITPLTGIMSNEAFDYCVQELRSKAQYYKESALIPTLDACATVVKSDTLISSDMQVELRNAFDKLKADQSASPDWHPNSSEMVQDLLHPSMYPLVYGRSRVLKEEVVGVNDAIEKWAGKGEVIDKDDSELGTNDRYSSGIGGSYPPRNFWSNTYQWLPSNVAFQKDGSVKFTSYINNLHPGKYPDMYRTIEKFIETVLPAWDQCLARRIDYHNTKHGAGRTVSRFSKPSHPDDDNGDNWDPSEQEETPVNTAEASDSDASPTAVVDLEEEAESDDSEEYDNEEDRQWRRAEKRWHKIRKPVQPQPDPFKAVDDFYVPKESVQLSKQFKDTGLQIIVKMASIELTPGKPEFPVGGWHVEGQMNERICATALYYLDSDNITSNNLSFRMQTSAYINDEYTVGQDAYHWMENIYGTELGCGNAPCLQNYGSVETKEGRLLAFPNVFQHRVSPFRLIDPTKPGHRRFVALWLVDPHIRIISTANVPPQQLNWWAESIFSDSDESISKLPAELVELFQQKGVTIDPSEKAEGKLPPELNKMLLQHFEGEGALLMGEEEAREHREKLMSERSAFSLAADDEWHHHSYSFCEH